MTKTKKALVLGGGGARGGYQIGVWQACQEMGMHFDIVTGSSVGAINGSLVAQGNLEEAVKMWSNLETSMVFEVSDQGDEEASIAAIRESPASEVLTYVKKFFKDGGAGTDGLFELLHLALKEEAVRSSPMDFGLVTVETTDLKPHILFKEDIPQGQLHDYIMASSSAFPVIKKYVIDGREFIDGCYYDVMPVEMAMEKGATEILAVNLHGNGIMRKRALEKAQAEMDKFLVIDSAHSLGPIYDFNKENTERIMRLGYLDTMKAYGHYDGRFLTFEKDVYLGKDLDKVDFLGKIFSLDPLVIYNRATFEESLLAKITNSQKVYQALSKDIFSIKEISTLWDWKLPESVLVIHIGEDIKTKKEDSLFMSKPTFDLFREYVFAAHYLISANLL